jgi:hypothetical protein
VPASEHRTVEFDSPAILQAFAAVPRMSEALGLRLGRVSRVDFQPEREAITVIDPNGTPVAELRAETLAALLVAYCSRIKVPLPRLGQKSVEVTSRSVVLRVATATRPDALVTSDRSDFPRAMVWNKSQPGG